MKAITYFAAVALGFVALVAPSPAKDLEGWTSNYEEAFKTAKKENKMVLLEFTGSDWCPPCIAMRKNVFSKKEFVEAASKKYVLVELDYPRKDKELAEKNEKYSEKYSIDAFPTVVLVDADGKEFSRFTASMYPKVHDFVKHINKQADNKDLD